MPVKLGRFRILEPLGADFIGSRYLAYDPQIGRQVVLRTLDPANEDREGLVREHFLQEARIAARLSHPNIVKVFGIHTDGPRPFVVLENLEGESLDELVAGEGPLSVERTVRLITPVVDALTYAHAEGVIHRDIRPGAIVVLPGDQPALTGFVMAKMADLVSAVTRQGLAVGTPGYASPELVTGGNADSRGDIFSLGTVIYEMTTGHQAFVGRNMAETLYRIAHADPEPPSSLVAGLDERHDRLLLRALAKSPEERQQTMGELRAELELWLDEGAAVAEPLVHTDEIPPDIASAGFDDTDRLPVLETESAHEPQIEPATAPGPVVTTPDSVFAEPDVAVRAEKAAAPPVLRVAGAKPAGPQGERKTLIRIIAASAAVLLVSLLAAWQFGWFGSSSVGSAAIGGDQGPAPVEQPVDADPVETGGTSALPTGTGESADNTAGEKGLAQGNVTSGDGNEGGADQPAGPGAMEAIAGNDSTDPPASSPERQKETVITPPPPTGILEVASLPWARVKLDGLPKGETPLRIDGVSQGEHRLSLVSASGKQWAGTVTIQGNRSTYRFHNFREGG
jgi:hypothetical protein